MTMKCNSCERGISLVEVLLGLSILSVVLVFVAFAITGMTTARERINSQLHAVYLAEAGYEYLRHIRDEDWNDIESLPVDTVRYLDVATSSIAITTTPEVIDGEYLRRFELREVYRDSSDIIVASTTGGADVDDEAYRVYMEVRGPYGTTTVEGVLTNLFAI